MDLNRILDSPLPPTIAKPPTLRTYVINLGQSERHYYQWTDDLGGNLRTHPFPNDEQEADRLHSFNDLIYAFALGDELFVSPVSLQEGDAVLDIGYRDGHWIDALTTKYPWAQIHGIDVLGFKPNDGRLTNPNVNLHTPVDFDGEAWGIAYSSISLARIALQCGNVRDWFSLYDRAKRYLRPGGYLELIEIDWRPRSEEPHVARPSQSHGVQEWYDKVESATRALGASIQYPEDTRTLLRQAGYVDAQHQVITLPFYRPALDDNYESALSRQLRVCMTWPKIQAFESLSLWPLSKHLHMNLEQVRNLCDRARLDFEEADSPLYYNLHIWTARRPDFEQRR